LPPAETPPVAWQKGFYIGKTYTAALQTLCETTVESTGMPKLCAFGIVRQIGIADPHLLCCRTYVLAKL
jgi:hypothetical protein